MDSASPTAPRTAGQSPLSSGNDTFFAGCNEAAESRATASAGLTGLAPRGSRSPRDGSVT